MASTVLSCTGDGATRQPGLETVDRATGAAAGGLGALSAIGLIYPRTGASAELATLASMLARMSHRGRHGSAVRSAGTAALGRLHFHSKPEDLLDSQPTVLPAQRGRLVLDGRLDNRDELWRALDGPPPLASLGDAALAALAYDTWGLDAFARFLGPFSVIVVDTFRQRAVLARDPLGGRGLAYSLGERCLFAASEELGLLGLPEVDTELDEHRLATLFAIDAASDGRTFFRGIRQLLPGHTLVVDRQRAVAERFWSPRPQRPRWDRRPEEHAEELRAALAAAVRSRMRAVGTPAVLMSGGLDSTPLAALARQHLGTDRTLKAVSWVFDRHPEADERPWIEATLARLGITGFLFAADEAMPFARGRRWPVHPSTPEQNPYRLLHEGAYAMARRQGACVLLSGLCGDQLYGGTERAFVELLARGALREAIAELAWQLREQAATRSFWANLLPFAWRLERGSRRAGPARPWLTERAAELLPEPFTGKAWASAFPRPSQALSLLDPINGHGLVVESYYALRHGIEVRYPLRDRRVVELALALPTSELRRQGETRPVLRRALAGQLPAAVLSRQGKATFAALFVEGIYRDGRERVGELLWHRRARWPEFVRRSVVETAWEQQDSGMGGLLLWLAVCLELWLETRAGASRLACASTHAATPEPPVALLADEPAEVATDEPLLAVS